MGPHVKNYKAGQKVLVNFMDATETIVQDPVLKETELIMPAGSLIQQINAPMRRVDRPVEYYYKWEHDIMGEILEDGE